MSVIKKSSNLLPSVIRHFIMDFYLLLKLLVKKISKNMSGKYDKNILDHVKQSAADTLKTTSKRVIHKIA